MLPKFEKQVVSSTEKVSEVSNHPFWMVCAELGEHFVLSGKAGSGNYHEFSDSIKRDVRGMDTLTDQANAYLRSGEVVGAGARCDLIPFRY